MSDQDVSSEEINHMINIMDTFSKMAKNAQSFTKTYADVQSAMKCAREVENIYIALKNDQLHFLFIEHMCKTLKRDKESYDVSAMQYACDTILQAILTSSNVPLSCVLCCLHNYIELCGTNRLSQLLSETIVHSEACRVLMDFIGMTEKDSQTSIIFQANLLIRMLTDKENETALNDCVYNWINSNENNRMHIVFQAVVEAGLNHDISRALIKGLVSVLDDRNDGAVLYWSTLISCPVSTSILKESRNLVYASLDFLTKCAENFNQTRHFTWEYHENGPCQVITFEKIVKYIQFLKSADDTIKPIVDTFIRERCSLPGCIFWEDIINNFLY